MHSEALGGGVAEFDSAVENRACPYLNQLGDTALGEMRNVYEQLDDGNFDAVGQLAEKLAAAASSKTKVEQETTESMVTTSGSDTTITRAIASEWQEDSDKNATLYEGVPATEGVKAKQALNTLINNPYGIGSITEQVEKQKTSGQTDNVQETIDYGGSEPESVDVPSNVKTQPAIIAAGRTEAPNPLWEMAVAFEQQRQSHETVIAADPDFVPTEKSSPTPDRHTENHADVVPVNSRSIAQHSAAMEEHNHFSEQFQPMQTDEASFLPDVPIPNPAKSDEASGLKAKTAEISEELGHKQLVDSVTETLSGLSEEIPTLSAEVIETVAEPTSDLLLSIDELPEQTEEDLLESGETWATIAAELEDIFEKQEIELSDEELIAVVDAMVGLEKPEPQDAQAEAIATTNPKFDETEPGPVEALVIEVLPEQTVEVMEDVHHKLKTMEWPAIEETAQPVLKALQTVQEVRLSEEPATESVELVTEDVVTVLREFFEQIQLEITEDDVRKFAEVLLRPDVLEHVLEDEGFIKLFWGIGTHEGRRFKSALQKVKEPIQNKLGELILRRFEVFTGENERFALAA